MTLQRQFWGVLMRLLTPQLTLGAHKTYWGMIGANGKFRQQRLWLRQHLGVEVLLETGKRISDFFDLAEIVHRVFHRAVFEFQ